MLVRETIESAGTGAARGTSARARRGAQPSRSVGPSRDAQSQARVSPPAGSDVVGEVEPSAPAHRSVKVGDRVVVSPGSRAACANDASRGGQPLPAVQDPGRAHERRIRPPPPRPRRESPALPRRHAVHAGRRGAARLPDGVADGGRQGSVRPGRPVLVQAGGSGVSSAAIQIAKLFGARVITTVGSDAKADARGALGADEVINYQAQDFVAEVKRLTGKRGADIVIEHVGGDVLTRSVLAAAAGARIVTCGATAGFTPTIDLRHIFFRQVGSSAPPWVRRAASSASWSTSGLGKLRSRRRSRPAAMAGGRRASGPRVARGVRQDRPRRGIVERCSGGRARRCGNSAPPLATRRSWPRQSLRSWACSRVRWRVLPWLLDPAVPWRVAQPFARGLAAVSLRGRPAGRLANRVGARPAFDSWSAERLASCKPSVRPPLETVARLIPGGAPLALALAGVALAVYGSDASAPGSRRDGPHRPGAERRARRRRAPGHVLNPLYGTSRGCAPPTASPAWSAPAPGRWLSVTLSARAARVAGDFRALDLDDARVLLPSTPPVLVSVGSLSDARYGPVGAGVDALRARPGARPRA